MGASQGTCAAARACEAWPLCGELGACVLYEALPFWLLTPIYIYVSVAQVKCSCRNDKTSAPIPSPNAIPDSAPPLEEPVQKRPVIEPKERPVNGGAETKLPPCDGQSWNLRVGVQNPGETAV